MNTEMINFIATEYTAKSEYILRNALSERKIQQAGIRLKEREIFVKYPRWPYYGSNYGRLIRMDGDNLTLLKESKDVHSYVVYKMTKGRRNWKGRPTGEVRKMSISGHRLVGDLFLPNYWAEMERGQLQVHHLDHNKDNNCWKNLVLVPTGLHYWLNRIEQIWFFTGKQFRRKTPYEIQRKTALSLEQILLVLKKEPGKIAEQGGKQILVYDVCGYFIGFEMVPQEDEE